MPATPPPAFSRAQIDRLLMLVPNWRLGVEGATNQGRLINETMRRVQQGDDDLATPAACLLFWAWQQRPLHRQLLQTLGGTLGAILPKDTAGLVDALRNAIQQNSAELADLSNQLDVAFDQGAFDTATHHIDILKKHPEFQDVATRLHAEWALFALPPAEAEPLVRAVSDHFGWWRACALARLALAAGDAYAATAIYADLWRAIPWHVNLGLTLSTLLRPVQAGPPPEPDEVCLLLYTWNKAGPLETALKHLLDSDTGTARLVALDNGSTDDTHALLSRMAVELGPDRVRIERLPVNIGAPAARNWLLSLEEVQRCSWMAFLDDDILLPPDWLSRLLATARSAPGAGAVGCRVVDATAPHCLQAADFNLLDSGNATGNLGMKNNFSIADTGLGSRETSLFNYTRPCLSVTGCCHLVNRKALETAGHFDIRFSPSQFDDLERDLRSALAGMNAVYEGRLAVPHMQHSSMKQATDSKKTGHIFGNMIKLEHLYEDRDKERLCVLGHTLAQDDLAPRLDELYERFGS